MDMARGRPRNLAGSSLSLRARTTTPRCTDSKQSAPSMEIRALRRHPVVKKKASFHTLESVPDASQVDTKHPFPLHTMIWKLKLDAALGLATGRPWLLTKHSSRLPFPSQRSMSPWIKPCGMSRTISTRVHLYRPPISYRLRATSSGITRYLTTKLGQSTT